MGKQKRIPLPKEFTEGQMKTQTEMLQVNRKSKQLYIGIPKEEDPTENRIALVPASVSSLIAHGHRVVIEAGAGERSAYPDNKYSELGADIAYSKEQVYKSDIILKVSALTMEELELCQQDQIIISPLQLPSLTSEYIHKLKEKKVIALAMEYIQDEAGSYPIVRIMSEIAGTSAMSTAATLLSKTRGGKGILLGGISGVPPVKVVILGAGVVAEFAIRACLGVGADIRVFDNNVYKLMRLQNIVGTRLNTSTLNPMQLEKEIINAEVVIGAIHSENSRTPMIVSEDIISKMKDGSVLIDISIDQGGCFETSELTTIDKPTFTKHGVIHYCVPNIASRFPRTASIAVSNIITPILLQAGSTGSIENLLYQHSGLRHGVYIYKGTLTNDYIGKRFGIHCTSLDLLIASTM
jgi:alanine dehydrogenase